MRTRVEAEGGEDEETLYDERLAVRRLSFRNTWHHPNRVLLQLDQSAESLASLGAPSWLVGSVFMLVPSVFDIHYWKSELHLTGISTKRERRPMGRVEDCLRMVAHFEFLDSGQVQFKSQLLAGLALEEWRRAQGNSNRLDSRNILTTLSDARKRPWFGIGFKKERFHPETVVIQDTITNEFPMGAYHGTDNRLILHQTGLEHLQLLDSTDLLPKQHFSYNDLNQHFHGVPCPNPKLDPRTGEVINVLCEYDRFPARYHVISLTLGMETFQDVPNVGQAIATFLAPPIKLEHFAITEHYVIIPIHSNRYPSKRKTPNFESNIVDGVDSLLDFESKSDTLFYVVSKAAKQLVAVYRSEPSHITSVVNAFEDVDTIYLDLVASSSPIPTLHLDEIRVDHVEDLKNFKPPSSTLRRYCLFRLNEEIARFDGSAGQLPSFPLALFHHLTDYPLSSPVVAPSVVGSPYRHTFGLSIDRDSRGKPGFFPNAIIKSDLSTPIKSMQWHRTGCYPSAPLFVPRAELAYSSSTTIRGEDDDGVIITVVLDVFVQRSYLIVLDARDLRELARYILPKPIPITSSTPVWCKSHTLPEKNTAALLTKE